MFTKLKNKIYLWIAGLLLDNNGSNTYDDNTVKFTVVDNNEFVSDFGVSESVMQTIKYETWVLKTKNHSLFCADNHMVLCSDNTFKMVKDLTHDDKIITTSGIQNVELVCNTGLWQHMYSISAMSYDVTSPLNNSFITNGIISSNTTTSAAYILWKASFTDRCTILICANKLDTAKEILDRVKFSYEELPDFLKCGVLEYNKNKVKFDNGSRIVCRATTKDAGRGLSVTLLYCTTGSEKVKVQDITTNEIKELTMEELYNDIGDCFDDEDSFGF